MSIEPLDPDVAETSDEIADRGCSSARLNSPRVEIRRGFIVSVLALGGLAIGLRLVQLQVLEHARLATRSTRQKSYVEVLPAPHCDLLDRDGRVLATSIVSHSLFVVPEKVADPWPCAQRFARALHIDPDRVCERLAQQSDK